MKQIPKQIINNILTIYINYIPIDHNNLEYNKSIPYVESTKKQSSEFPTVLAGILIVLIASTVPGGIDILNPSKIDNNYVWLLNIFIKTAALASGHYSDNHYNVISILINV